jgi:GTPase KRas protein
MIDDHSALLDILDTAGQEEFSSMQDQWMRDGKGFLLVYNITSRPTFDEVTNLYEKILRTKDTDKVPMYVFYVLFGYLPFD